MQGLTANFNRTYNPNVRQNALTHIKNLLRSRETTGQNQACEYLTKVLNHYHPNSNERAYMVDYLLENDITYFLCEAISNLNFELFKSVSSCLRLLWHSSTFFEKEHAAQAMSAVVRALTYYSGSGPKYAVGACLHFLDDLLNGISRTETTSALSHQSAYSAVQLLACLNNLPHHINTNPMTVLSSALVLHALISYQPTDLIVQSSLVNSLFEVLKKWFSLLMATLNQTVLKGDEGKPGMFFAVLCQLGIDGIGRKVDFVQTIITDEQEINTLKQCSIEIGSCILQVLNELIIFTKVHQSELSNEEYEIFLKLLLKIFYEFNGDIQNSLTDFSDMMLSNSYLAILPQVQIQRDDPSVRKYSTLLLGELLKVLAIKYLNINENMENTSANDIHMSTISSGSPTSLDERVYLEKATNRLILMLHPEPSTYYTHNPVILLWAFTSKRIPKHVQMQVVTQWLETGDSLPTELTNKPIFLDILLKILVTSISETVIENCMDALQFCLTHDGREEFATVVWSMLPDVLSRGLIDFDSSVGTNICYIIDLATTVLPKQLNPTLCINIAILISAIYSKSPKIDVRYHFEYVSLKLSLCLLKFADKENDNRVLTTFMNRSGYMTRVLSASNSADDGVACAAMELLSYIVYYFKKNNYQPKSVIHIQTDLIIQSLTRDGSTERGASLLQLLYVIINSGVNAPLALAYDFGDQPCTMQQHNALRALMFRIQISLCSVEEPNSQAVNGWNILNSIFKHAIVTKNDTKLVALLTSQPWTNILIQFQLSQKITQEFLTFIYKWLILLKITLKNSQEVKIKISKQNLFINTLIQIKKKVHLEEEPKALKENVMATVKEILDQSGIKIN
ncbi:hypothetical protein K1T71_010112 [Dendrolimus kikuchii]|uniref:Uncharacterized protein n=1 Tax=Dendrolimus kikuchii TaxID=765133 RepID=A0ACC1CQV6_9NEOP|nr:hypothetical protein K1T71_010112 [Dendrolimus kikuchii]